MKKNILCAILLVLNLLSVYYLHINNQRRITDFKTITETMDGLFRENLFLREDIISIQQGACVLSPQQTLYEESGNSTKLSNITKMKTKYLVLRYSSLSCTPCVDNAIAAIKKFSKENPDINILLLATYQFQKDLKVFKKMNKLFTQVYNVRSLNLPIENRQIPYLFVLDEELQVLNTFIPRKEIPELTEQYLEKMKELFVKY